MVEFAIAKHYHNFYLLLLTDESRSRDWYKELFKRFSVIAEESGIQVKVAVGIQVSKVEKISICRSRKQKGILTVINESISTGIK